jgi:hypothetical protein
MGMIRATSTWPYYSQMYYISLLNSCIAIVTTAGHSRLGGTRKGVFMNPFICITSRKARIAQPRTFDNIDNYEEVIIIHYSNYYY